MENSEQILKEKELIRQKLKESGKDSAHNSDEEAGEREQRENLQDKEVEKIINYDRLGEPPCIVTPDMEEVEFSMTFRIAKIENLEKCVNLTVMKLNIYYILETRTKKESNKEN